MRKPTLKFSARWQKPYIVWKLDGAPGNLSHWCVYRNVGAPKRADWGEIDYPSAAARSWRPNYGGQYMLWGVDEYGYDVTPRRIVSVTLPNLPPWHSRRGDKRFMA